MPFSISLLGEGGAPADAGHSLGHVVAGDLDEDFVLDTSYWEESEYVASWLAELQRLMSGCSTSVLLTAAAPLSVSNWLQGYVLYRFGDEVRVQEAIFLVQELPSGAALEEPSSLALPYEAVSEDGTKISEWRTDVADIRAFLEGHSLTGHS